MPLQRLDGIVYSVLELRDIFAHLNDKSYAEWYSARYMVSEERVMNILKMERMIKNGEIND